MCSIRLVYKLFGCQGVAKLATHTSHGTLQRSSPVTPQQRRWPWQVR